MKYKSILLVLISIVSIFITFFAQPQGNQSYNFTHALEEAKKGNKADAIEYLSKEVNENPNNGHAHLTMAILQADAENYSDAMTSINLAIKKLPKKDKEGRYVLTGLRFEQSIQRCQTSIRIGTQEERQAQYRGETCLEGNVD